VKDLWLTILAIRLSIANFLWANLEAICVVIGALALAALFLMMVFWR
jgi:hypothetical protein